MGKLFKAATGFGIAFYIWSPANFAVHFETPTVTALRTQIEAEHPRAKLAAQWSGAQTQLNALTR